MGNRRTMILCLCLLLAPIGQAQNENVLDLTKIKVVKKEVMGPKTGGGVSTSRGHSQPVEYAPLKITLLSLDKRRYALGEEVIYEVKLENITEEILVIPWSPDRDAVKPEEESDPPGYVVAILRLVIMDETSGDQFVTGQVLYGSHLEPSSLKYLWPGEMVKIRAPSRWDFLGADVAKRIREQLPRTFEVRARFSFLHGAGTSSYKPALSANSWTIELTKLE